MFQYLHKISANLGERKNLKKSKDYSHMYKHLIKYKSLNLNEH